jgi:hypothetical protein
VYTACNIASEADGSRGVESVHGGEEVNAGKANQ